MQGQTFTTKKQHIFVRECSPSLDCAMSSVHPLPLIAMYVHVSVVHVAVRNTTLVLCSCLYRVVLNSLQQCFTTSHLITHCKRSLLQH